MKTLEGQLTAQGMKVAIVVARFNEFITSKLLSGAIDCLERQLLQIPAAAVSPYRAGPAAQHGWQPLLRLAQRGRDPHQRHPRERAQDAGAAGGAGGADPQALRCHGDQGGLLPARRPPRLQQRHLAGGSPLLMGPLHPVAGTAQSAGTGDPDRN